MALPPNDQESFVVSSRGFEQVSSGVLAKSSYWVVYKRFNSLSLINYDGEAFTSIRSGVEEFHLSQALDSGYNLDSSLLWLWEITMGGVLRLVEIEPFPGEIPVINSVTILDTGVVNVRSFLIEGSPVRVMILKSGTPNTLWLNVYTDIKSGTPDLNAPLEWTSTRLDNFDFDNYISDYDVFLQVYPDQLSQPNIYTVSSSLSIPQLISLTQVGESKSVIVQWDTITGGEDYRLERSTNDPTFSPANTVEVYFGPNTSFTDVVPNYLVAYYYRVKLVMTSSLLESGWSSSLFLLCYSGERRADLRSFRSWITQIGYVYSPFKCPTTFLPYLARFLGYNLKYEDFLVSAADTAKKRIQIKELPKTYRLKGTNRSFSYIFEVLEGTTGTTDLDPELAWVQLYDGSWDFVPDPRDYTVWIPLNSYPDDPDPNNPGFDYIPTYAIDSVKGPNYVPDSRLRLNVDPLVIDDLDLANILSRIDEVKPYHLIFDFTYTPDVVSELYEEFFFGEWPDLYHDDLSSYHDKSDLPDYYHSRAGGPDTLAVAKKDVSLLTTPAIGEWVSIIPT